MQGLEFQLWLPDKILLDNAELRPVYNGGLAAAVCDTSLSRGLPFYVAPEDFLLSSAPMLHCRLESGLR